MKKFAVVAIGGNSLIRDKEHLSVEDQYEAIVDTAISLVDIVEAGCDIIVTHGNGPQVGFIQRRSEIAFKYEGLHLVPLVSCVADTQGAIGYQIQQALNNEFQKRGLQRKAVTVVTRVRVDKNDPALKNPTKPIGAFFPEKEVEQIKKLKPNWILIQDAGRGYRRVVPSPKPVEIVEMAAISSLVKQHFCVIAVGGGGIPVMDNGNGVLEGVDAVVDKDYAAVQLAHDLKSELLIISTGVDNICLNFGTSKQKPLGKVSLAEIKQYLTEGHFAAGSMLPKIRAVISFLENGGQEAIITQPKHLKSALLGKRGTQIFKKV